LQSPSHAPAQSIADLLNRWRNRFSRSKGSSQPEHLRRGASGEKLACRFLRSNGYKILHRNFKGRTGGEIDIVCRDQDTLVFVEVKTRTREDFGRPLEAVDRQKQKRISRGGLAWLRMLDNPDILFRFDVVEVILSDDAKPRLELIQNAFQLSAPYIY
jgi:putative endonuclease